MVATNLKSAATLLQEEEISPLNFSLLSKIRRIQRASERGTRCAAANEINHLVQTVRYTLTWGGSGLAALQIISA